MQEIKPFNKIQFSKSKDKKRNFKLKIIGDTFQSTLKETEALMKKKKRIAMVKELFPDKADIMKMATSSTERRN